MTDSDLLLAIHSNIIHLVCSGVFDLVCSTWCVQVCSQRHFVGVIVFYIVVADKQAEQAKNTFNACFSTKLSFKLVFVVVKGIDSLCCFVLSRTRVSSIMLFGCVNN